ncbi:MAG: radical SAM protein [Thermodesulfobacteriota bacterium]
MSFLVLMLTRRCNLTCAYCYARAGAAGADMAPETARRAIARLGRGDGRLTVELTGGEPLLNFGLVRELVLAHAGQAPPPRFALQTNALLLDRAKLDFLLEHGVGLGLSLDGDPATNDLTRGHGAAVVKALRRLDAAGAAVNLTVVLTRHNIARLPELLLLAAGFRSVRVINLDLVRPLGRAQDADLAPTPDQVREMAPRLLANLAFIATRRWPPLKVREVDQVRRRAGQAEARPYCLAAAGQSAAVTPEGEIYPCAGLAGRPEHLAGRLDDPDPPDLERTVRHWGLPPACAACAVRFICRGGCPSRRIATQGDPRRPYDLECLLRQELFRRMQP